MRRIPSWVWILFAVAVGIVLVVTTIALVHLLNPRYAFFVN